MPGVCLDAIGVTLGARGNCETLSGSSGYSFATDTDLSVHPALLSLQFSPMPEICVCFDAIQG